MSPLEGERKQCPICHGDSAKVVNKDLSTGIHTIDCKVCGKYELSYDLFYQFQKLDSILEEDELKKYRGQEYILSGVTRNAYKRGNPIEITHKNIAYLIDGAPNPSTPLEVLDQVLLYISNKSQPFDFTFPLNLEFDYPLFYAKNGSELKYVLSNPEYKGYLDLPQSARINQST